MAAKYDKIGSDYDDTRRADPTILRRLVSHLQIDGNGRYLDVACGSGNYTSAMARTGGSWSGIDQSSVMLAKAKLKSSDVTWILGSAEDLPFGEGLFDGVTCTLAIHHFISLEEAFLEVRRVMRESRFVIFTSTAEQMKGYWLEEYFPVAMKRSRDQMPRLESIESALAGAGLRVALVDPYFVHADLQDLFLYSGKHRPAMCLEASFRRGISTFSSLADEEEIVRGCERLRADIESDKITGVIQNYENDLGDYCFIVSEKAA